MANIYLESDNGEAIIYDGVAYEFVSSSINIPDSPSEVEYSNITSLTHNVADDQGKTEYTSGERALALYEYGCKGNGTVFGNGTSIVYTATQDGVFRLWYENNMDAWYVNGIQQTKPSANAGEINSRPVNVLSGDVITCYENQFSYILFYSFLPFNH